VVLELLGLPRIKVNVLPDNRVARLLTSKTKKNVLGGAAYGQSADCVVVSVGGLWIPFHDKHYSIRLMEGRFVLWDEDDNRSLN
jgi:hypothetical protein